MEIGVYPVVDAESFELVEPGEGPLDGPARPVQAGTLSVPRRAAWGVIPRTLKSSRLLMCGRLVPAPRALAQSPRAELRLQWGSGGSACSSNSGSGGCPAGAPGSRGRQLDNRIAALSEKR